MIYIDRKLLLCDLKFNEKVLVNNKYFFELKLNYEKEKLFLFVYDLYGNLIERDAFINFDSLRSHLKIKLSSLALIYASKKRIECVDYFRYYKMIIYELKSFDVFLKLLEKNIVKVSIACRVSRSGIREGEQRNKNLVFKIFKKNSHAFSGSLGFKKGENHSLRDDRGSCSDNCRNCCGKLKFR